jgi:uncharacterized protein YigE (DUF2233 family)
MKRTSLHIFSLILVISILSLLAFTPIGKSTNNKVYSYVVDPKIQELNFYWKDDNGKILKTISNLKAWLKTKNKELVFAMNGGMFMQNYTPLGLYIKDQKTITSLNSRTGTGNFYMSPNAVFYITNTNEAYIKRTIDFSTIENVKSATQSGPMLLVNGVINKEFTKGSSNVNIRNGVGILPNNKILFAISNGKINFYDFAEYCKNAGCKEALYLDGYVSKMYLPELKMTNIEGNFGVLVGVTKIK